MPSQQYLDLEQRLKAGDQPAASDIIALAGAGDADALFKAAEFRLRGIAGPVDLKTANRLMARAASLGHEEARRAQCYFIGAGVGCKADSTRARSMMEQLTPDDRFAAVQLAFLSHVQCGARLKTAERRLISTDPHIELVLQLFSPEECRYIRLLAEPWLEPAMIYRADGGAMRDPHRDSDNMVVTPMSEDLIIQAINRCIAEATGTGYTWGEPLHVLRYRPGQQYRPHHDAHTLGPVEKRRIATALLYLNDDYEGGETWFPDLKIKVRGGTGDLLVFHNLDEDGIPHPRMTHAGLPIRSGEKWLATRWIRGSDYFAR